MIAPATERHPLEPFLPEGARLLLLGSFPPARSRWSMAFYYPNLQNDMWRILGLIFCGAKEHFLTPDGRAFDAERIRAFCAAWGIALTDTARAVRRLRGNASDAFLEVVEPLDVEGLFARLPSLTALAATGQKAAETLAALVGCTPPAVGVPSVIRYGGRTLNFYRMPSTSRAYPLPVERKAEAYRTLFRREGLLAP